MDEYSLLFLSNAYVHKMFNQNLFRILIQFVLLFLLTNQFLNQMMITIL